MKNFPTWICVPFREHCQVSDVNMYYGCISLFCWNFYCIKDFINVGCWRPKTNTKNVIRSCIRTQLCIMHTVGVGKKAYPHNLRRVKVVNVSNPTTLYPLRLQFCTNNAHSFNCLFCYFCFLSGLHGCVLLLW